MWVECHYPKTYLAFINHQLWEEQGLDLELIPYGCMATGPQTGFIEVVKNAKTIAEVNGDAVGNERNILLETYLMYVCTDL